MIVILKFLLLGVVTGELIYILFSGFGFVTDYTVYDTLFFYVQLFIIALMVLALFMPGNLAKICGMFLGRWDLTLYFLLGTIISVSFQGFHVTEFLYHLTSFQYALIELGFFIPFVVRAYYRVKKGRASDQGVPHSSFLDDAALYDGADLLQYGPLAEDFANKIYDNKSPNSMIWGVEGPWGIGKSSFLNLCEESLRKNHPGEVTVFRFNALKYSSQYRDISISLSDTLRETVYKTLKCPELDILLVQYQRMIKGISFNVLGISMNFAPSPRNESKVFTYISEILRNSNKKFIFTIDDLDRLNGEEVYSLLYSIKEIFDIPFINYVLCYDLDNLSKEMGTDKTAQKNVEFLEKFVQTKISLFTRKDVILRVLDEDIKILMKDTDLDVEANKKALKGVRNILTSDDAAEYIPFLGDLRKVKRYVNTLTALDIQRVDFPDREIHKLTPELLDGDESLIGQEIIDYSQAQEMKDGITTFIAYQIGNNILSEMGIGCGYYDESGTDDGQGIRKAFTKYLLDDVFQDSYYWQSFLLILAKNDQLFRESGKIGCDRVIECMGEEQLKSWWLTKGKNMMKLNLKIANYKPQVNGISSQEILRMYSESFEERFKCNPAIADEPVGKADNAKKSSVETDPLD